MKKRLRDDLKDFSLIMEEILAEYKTMPEEDLIDVAAFLKPIAKGCKSVDDYVKDEVKGKLHHKDGSRLGSMFKAVLQLIPVNRLDQTALKEGSPNIHKKYVREYIDERVTFEVR